MQYCKKHLSQFVATNNNVISGFYRTKLFFVSWFRLGKWKNLHAEELPALHASHYKRPIYNTVHEIRRGEHEQCTEEVLCCTKFY
jgi:hypothetical protein